MQTIEVVSFPEWVEVREFLQGEHQDCISVSPENLDKLIADLQATRELPAPQPDAASEPVALPDGEELWVLRRDSTGHMHGVRRLHAAPPAPVPAGEVMMGLSRTTLARKIYDDLQAKGLLHENLMDWGSTTEDAAFFELADEILTAAQPRADAGEVTEALPEEPTRKMWAAMADACVEAHHQHDRPMSLAPDFITGPIYAALRAVLTARGGRS